MSLRVCILVLYSTSRQISGNETRCDAGLDSLRKGDWEEDSFRIVVGQLREHPYHPLAPGGRIEKLGTLDAAALTHVGAGTGDVGAEVAGAQPGVGGGRAVQASAGDRGSYSS